MRNKFWDFLGDNLVSIATVIGGLAVLILSMIGTVDTLIILQAILGLLILLATSGIVERHKRLDAIQESIVSLGESNIEVKVFKDIDEHYRFLEERITYAQKHVDIINFRPTLPRNPSSRQRYAQTFEKRIKTGSLCVRRVTIPYSSATIDWIGDLLKKYNKHNYWISYYKKPPEYVPLLNMMLIDGIEVFIGGFYQQGQFDERGTIWLRDSKIAGSFQEYYNYLWLNAHPLNPNETIQEDALAELARELKQNVSETILK